MSRYKITKDKFLSKEEVEKIEGYFEKEPSRDTLILMFALLTGARASEILAVKKSDLDSKARSVYVRGLKGSNDREVPLPQKFFRVLERYSAECETETLFPISYRRLAQIWDLYRPSKKTFHALRHTFAMGLYSKTHDLRLTQVALGHRNIANTMVYADYQYSQSEMRKLMRVR